MKWQLGLDACPVAAIRVSLINEAVDTSLPDDALGAAWLAEPRRIRLFADRIHSYTNRPRSEAVCAIEEAHVMAHVLTHEISHVVEGANRRSDQGVMKAQWDAHDLLKMKRGSLPFAPVDVELIRAGIAGRELRFASAGAKKPVLTDCKTGTTNNLHDTNRQKAGD